MSPISEAFAVSGQEPGRKEVWTALLAYNIDSEPGRNGSKTFHLTEVGELACKTYDLTDTIVAGSLHQPACYRMMGDLETWGAFLSTIVLNA